jgi:RNA polymerase sigma-70 factor (ECF subfamily)
MQPEELAELLDRYGALLRAVAAQRCRWPDDCVQEALIRLAGLDQPPRQPLAWLIATVQHLALDQTRSDTRRAAREQRVAERSMDRQRGAPGDRAIDAVDLRHLLDRLDEADRQLVLMRVWGGMGFAELASATGGSVAGIHRRYTKILEQLRLWWDAPCPQMPINPIRPKPLDGPPS